MLLRRLPTLLLIAVFILFAGIALVAWASLTPEADRSFFQWGLLQLIYTLDQGLPVLAFGGALAKTSLRLRLVSIVVFALAFTVGLFVVSSAITVLGPLCLVIVGIALAIPTTMSNVAIPILAAVLGTGIAMTLSYDRPTG